MFLREGETENKKGGLEKISVFEIKIIYKYLITDLRSR